MAQETGTGNDDLKASLVIRVEEVCDQFEAAWRAAETSGERPRLEECLADVPEPERRAVLPELIALDLAYRQRGRCAAPA